MTSDDGGDSWSRGVKVGDDAGILALAVHPEKSTILYAAGNSGVYRSTDGGITWERVFVGGGLQAIVFHPEDPYLIYAAGHRAAFSADGGDTWDEYGDGYSIAASPVAPHRMILALGKEGVAVQESLQDLPTPTPPHDLAPPDAPTVVYADAMSFDPDDPMGLYALVSDPPRLGYSDDGGANWITHPLTGATTIVDPPVALVARPISPTHPVSPTSPISTTDPLGPTGTRASLVALGHQTAYSLTWGEDGVAVESWSLPNAGTAKETRPLLISPSNPNLLLSTGVGGVLRSEDGGQTWNVHPLSPKVALGQPSSLALCGAAPSSAQSVAVYAAAEIERGDGWEQMIYRSQDGGRTWEIRSVLTDTHRLASLVGHPTDPNIVYGGGKGFYQSDDNGATWQVLHPEIAIRYLAIVPGDPWLLYAITEGEVARSDDGGVTWTVLCSGGLDEDPAEFLTIGVAPVGPFGPAQDKPRPVLLLARPADPKLELPAVSTCGGWSAPQYDLRQGWQQSKEGLPVFVEQVTSR